MSESECFYGSLCNSSFKVFSSWVRKKERKKERNFCWEAAVTQFRQRRPCQRERWSKKYQTWSLPASHKHKCGIMEEYLWLLQGSSLTVCLCSPSTECQPYLMLLSQLRLKEGRRREGREAFGGNCHDSLRTHAGCHARILVWKSDSQKKDGHVRAGALEQNKKGPMCLTTCSAALFLI